MRLRKINIGTRLALGFGLIVVLSVVVGAVALNNISKATKAAANMYNHPYQVSNAVRDIKTNVIAIHRSMKDLAVASNEFEMLQAERLTNEYEKNVYEAFELVFNQFLGDTKDVEKAYGSFAEWKPIREEVIRLWQSGENAEAIKITKGKGAEHVEKVLSDVNIMMEFAGNKADEFYKETQLNKGKAYDYMRGLLAVVLLISIVVVILISISLIMPIRALIINARKIETGNLKARNVIRYNDEISKLAISFNSMADSIDSREEVLKGLSEISSEMIGKEELTDFAHSLVSKFIEFTKSQLVVFYVLNKTINMYEPIESTGANVASLKSFSATNPEGEFGNLLSKKEIYYLKKIPKSTIFNYKSTIGDIVPREVLSIPIVVNNEVVAVISCANIRRFSMESIDIIIQAQSLLNASYATLIANQETKQYSKKIESINQELEMKSEELQQQTEELQQQSKELERSRDKLYEQNMELEMQRIKVEEANRLKSEFLSNMSHELRTPLNSINALSKVLIMQAANKLDDDENNYLTIIERNGKRLLALINNILDLSKVEAGKMEIHTKVFSLSTALALITENVQPLADTKGVDLNLDILEHVEIESDESRLNQVVTNVLGNAIKFTEKGKIEVKLEEDEDEDNAIITISDTGIGIANDVLPYIFHEFRQADGTTSRSYEGTGLGLAIAKKIIIALNGSISVESKEGVGSTFIIEIPLKFNGNTSARKEVNSTSAEKVGEIHPKIQNAEKTIQENKNELVTTGKNIMIIEDNESTIVQVQKVLENQGLHINHASSGKEALEILKTTKPDGIILDLMMPEMDGFEVLEKIRRSEETRNIPVLILTAKNLTKKELGKLSVNNIQQLIQKGDVDIDELISKVNTMLRIIKRKNKPEQKPTEITTPKTMEIFESSDGLPKLLLIEDNPDNRITARAILGNRYFIVEAEDGVVGMQMVFEEKPDLILLDISIPEKDGIELIKEIRENELTKDIPVIAITARAMKDDRENLIRAGCDEYVSKPIDDVELLEKISRFI